MLPSASEGGLVEKLKTSFRRDIRRKLYVRGEQDALRGKPARGKSEAYLWGYLEGKLLLDDKKYFHQKNRLK